MTDDTITYGYDELGRTVARSINGAGLTMSYDAIGRRSTELNTLGTFTYGYDGLSDRLASVAFPNGQMTSYTYLTALNEKRLQTIHHKRANASTLSRHDYTYDAAGNILTWQQQADSAAPELWDLRLDGADQLASAVKSSTGTTPAVLKRFAYTYDPAGNRTTEQIDNSAMSSTYDVLNRLTQRQPGGVLRFAGTVSEPASVTIQGKLAVTDAANGFAGGVAVVPGPNTVSIQAADPNGNIASAQYQVNVTGTGQTLTYDANGNLISDGRERMRGMRTIGLFRSR